MDSKVFVSWLEDIMCACEEIKEAQLCDCCPMRSTCLEDTSLEELTYDTPRDHFAEIIKMGQNPRFYILGGDEQLEVLYKNR